MLNVKENIKKMIKDINCFFIITFISVGIILNVLTFHHTKIEINLSQSCLVNQIKTENKKLIKNKC